MIPRSVGKLILSVFFVAVAAAPTTAATIDFESTALGNYSSLTFGTVTIEFLAGTGTFDVQNQNPGGPLGGHVLMSYFTNAGEGSFEATFGGTGVSSVSISVGDYAPSDVDETHLRAYDQFNNLLDTDFYLIPASGPNGTLTVSSLTPIARVEWNETGDFAGAVYWDNLTYTDAVAAPEPASLSLMLLGTAGYLARRRRR